MADEELSVASSTSWWVLEEELKRQKRSSNCVIKLTKEQYAILKDIGAQTRFMGNGFYWKPKKQIPKWEAATRLGSGRGRLMLPLCMKWMGHIRIALIKMGVANADALYRSIKDILPPLMSSSYHILNRWDLKKAMRDPDHHHGDRPHPLDFLIFTHIRDGDFSVTVSTHNVTLVPYNSVSPVERDSSVLGHLRSVASSPPGQCGRVVAPVSDVKLTKFKDSTPVAMTLEERIHVDDCEDDHSPSSSACFGKELEKCFAMVYCDEVDPSDVNTTQMEEMVFSQNVYNGQWTINPLVTTEIETSLKKFIEKRGKEIMEGDPAS